jgi:hypothetical protein
VESLIPKEAAAAQEWNKKIFTTGPVKLTTLSSDGFTSAGNESMYTIGATYVDEMGTVRRKTIGVVCDSSSSHTAQRISDFLMDASLLFL